ncbi:hydroxymethylpyrimidine/phosphomethylpyrimidine kinase [Putridiphycobacter roseus]|uniref:hydroxymethylpyrimidine kinase n=1 Tax=Putridiphycobacter roseus TaxID=2219161 RepID=A0A2W1MYN4_9FLAO|nr:hydroxymethylpyrimidine/phosphomethylpyrimidine kinase [Putridiphycobacter roseus]
MTIAGFDPSGGAGILADIKTMEQNGCIGMAVQTANTIQTGDKFLSCNWIDEAIVQAQLELLLSTYKFDVVKIGLVPNLKSLNQWLNICLTHYPALKIVWDPVLSASAGFNFQHNLDDLAETLALVDFITPNWEEAKILSGNEDAIIGAAELSKYCAVLLKGGHHPTQLGKDRLFLSEKTLNFNPKPYQCSPKHGSGCIFASALACNIAKGYPIHKSVLKSKRYIEAVLSSQTGLIGYHAP